MLADQRSGIPGLLTGMIMMKYFIFLTVCLLSIGSRAETRIWTFRNGKTLEAEFIAYSGADVALKGPRGKVKKIPIERFSPKDLEYLELSNPPDLELALGKSSTQRVYPPTYSQQELPRQTLFKFTARVRQKSGRIYHRPLTLEMFLIGKENAGDKYVLYEYRKEEFSLPEGSGSIFELRTDEIPVTEYVQNAQLRGDAYAGYILVVTDIRGQVIASKAKKEDWLSIVENLRRLPKGKTFDIKTGLRTWPSRPKRYY